MVGRDETSRAGTCLTKGSDLGIFVVSALLPWDSDDLAMLTCVCTMNGAPMLKDKLVHDPVQHCQHD